MGRKKSETSKLDVQGKANSPFAKRLSGLIAEKDNGKELEHFLGVSPQAINQYKNGESRPSLDNICKIADFYHVSVDYLLGRTDTKSANTDIQTAVKITGLSEASIQYLHFLNQIDSTEYAYAIDQLVSDCKVHNYDDNKKRDYRAILGLLAYFFAYQNRGVDKIVYSNGVIRDRPHPNRIPSNAIALDDTIIENAVLAEIQHALINLKRVERENAKNSTD